MYYSERNFTSKRSALRIMFVFFSYGLVKMMSQIIIYGGVEDIMENSSYSSGWVSVSLNVPYIFATIIFQSLQEKVKNIHRMWFSFVTIFLGSVGVGYLPSLPLRLASVSFIGSGAACCETATMSLTARYPEAVIQAFIMGDAVGRLLSPFIYLGLTTYFCITPRLVFATTSIASVIFPLYYHLVVNKGKQDYEPVKQDPDDVTEHQPNRQEAHLRDQEEEETEKQLEGYESITWPVMLFLLYKSFLRFYANFLGFAYQTLCLQAFYTTLVFKDSPFQPREHYQYYLIAAWIGGFIGRTYKYFFKCSDKATESCSLSTDTESFIQVVFGLCNFAVLFIAIWYRNMPNAWVVMLLAFNTGLITGVGYVVAFSPVSEKKSHIVFTRTASIVIHGFGCVIPAMVAIVLEPMIRQRCFEVTHTREYCIARYIGIGRKPCYSTD